MDFEELLDQEKKAQQERSEAVLKMESDRREALERWSKGVQDFMRLSLPTVQFGWVFYESKKVGFFSRRMETKYHFHGLGEGWLLQRDIPGNGDSADQCPIFLATNGDLYGDHASHLQDIGTTYVPESDYYSRASQQQQLWGTPSGEYCALKLVENKKPLPTPPGSPDTALKLLAAYAVANQ